MPTVRKYTVRLHSSAHILTNSHAHVMGGQMKSFILERISDTKSEAKTPHICIV